MPIRPSERARYPRDWKAISLRIRERAQNRCECDGRCGYTHLDENDKPATCGAPNGKLILRDEYEPELFVVHSPCGACVGGDPDHKPVRVVLTVAHLNHTPEDCRDENLMAMCQRCHLSLDRYHHGHNARETRRSRKAHRDLFDSHGPLTEAAGEK